MKKTIASLMAAGAFLMLTGCSSVQNAGSKELNGMPLTDSGTTVAHVSGNAAGFYFLWFPLFTGSTQTPGNISCFGEDSCNVTAVTKMVTAKSKSLGGAKTVDMVSLSDSSMVPIPIPYLFYWKTATVSGNSIR